MWGATNRAIGKGVCVDISIHAPRVGSDSKHAQIHLCDSFIIRQNYRKRQLISACNTCFTAYSLEKSILLKVRTSQGNHVRFKFAPLYGRKYDTPATSISCAHVEYRIEAQKFGDATYITFWVKRSDGVSKLLTCI